ncbi:hypothetical protein [Albidovulum sp.]|uniref:hypothetical protein n=1 Tax=Albidovulum sp. TaxID=1872424 RepID=UPI0025B94888|nr:hypothetical protein [Defluviimonas sp.]
MTSFRAPIVALCMSLAALPAAAGGISFDLPRLEFPASGADASRDCTLPLLPGAPHP